jgi:hypothetical protein
LPAAFRILKCANNEKEVIILKDKNYELYLKKIEDGTIKPTEYIKIEGVGEIEVFGEWNAEKLITRLLENESITG